MPKKLLEQLVHMVNPIWTIFFAFVCLQGCISMYSGKRKKQILRLLTGQILSAVQVIDWFSS